MLWIGIIFLSLSLIVLHRHDHDHEADHHKESTQHSHDDDTDCQYCYLFFQQAVQIGPTFQWLANPFEFQINFKLNNFEFETPVLSPQTSKSLRAPPSSILS